MKYLIVLLLLSPIFGLAQKEIDSKIDHRLYEIFDGEYLEQLQTQRPFLIQRWSFYLDHAFYITEDPKLAEYDYPIVRIDNIKDFNILKIEREQALNRYFKKESTYRIEGTNKALIYYPAKVFNEHLNHYLKRSSTEEK